MDSERPINVSVLDPVTLAIDRTKLILFNPFELSKWLVIGFCAFLATLGTGKSGPRFNYNTGNRGGGSQDFHQFISNAKEFTINNLGWIIPLGIFIILFFIALALLLVWLSSRGRFMLLHCVAENKAEVKIPWAKFREHANSLFLFRIVLGLIGFVVILVPVIFIAILIFGSISAGSPQIGALFGIIAIGLCVFVISICFGIVTKFTTDFVVPIMFLRTISVRAAWHEFLSVLSLNKGRFLLYLLFHLVIGLVIMTIVMIGVCCTCCCLACVMAIPYVGSVIFLPIFVFQRSYSLYYFKQYGSQFDVFEPVQVEENPQPQLPEDPF